MIENVVQIPKINGKLLQPIITSTGLKQGDNLSPILFDVFFDDVDQIFDSQCNPVIFNSEISLNHLLYADDMAILSLSQEGLQNSLNKLETYCKEWHLVVSINPIPHGGRADSALLQIVFFITSVRDAAEPRNLVTFPKI